MPTPKDKEPNYFFYSLCQVVLFTLYKLFFNFRTFDSKNVPRDTRGIILAPNHASYLDPPLLGISLKKPITYLAKEYLFKKPVWGTLIDWLGVLPIQSEGDDFRSMRQLLRALKNGRQIVVFPEGTRSETGELRQPEGGVGFLAIKSHAYVVPVYIEGSYEAFPKGKKFFRCHPIRVFYGKPFIPADDAKIMAEPDPYTAVGERIMAEIREMKSRAATIK